MKKLKQAGQEYLLEESLEALHRESNNWLSELELWRIDLSFFQKIMDHNSPNFTSKNDKKRMSHFQHLITYYAGEVMDRFEQMIRRHEKYLATEMINMETLDESNYRKKHAEIASHVGAFRIEFIKYKREFYDFIEKLI